MATPYYLAIDVGTSRTAAATARSAPDGALLAAPLPLGRNADSTPTTVFISDSGLLFGDAAERRGTAQPERLVREFKRRIGDDVPIVAGDRRFSPQDLYALVVGWVIGTAVEREGQHPAGIAVSVPVTWGEYRTQLVQDAIGRLGWNDVQIITEPEAAARHYEATHPLGTGRALAVYDFGGGTFDTVILQKAADGRVDFVGSPVGIPDLGGADFDDIVLRHTVRAAGIPASALAGVQSDAGLRMAVASLRRECVDAKESLSFDGEAVVPVLIGDGHGAVRLTRAEFEDMIEPEIERTVEVMEIALEQSGLTADDLDAILLTGGTSRIPRVAQLLSERFDRPIAIDADPKAIIALGAARTAAVGAVEESPALFELADVDEHAPVVDDDEDDDDIAAESGFSGERVQKRAPWFRRVPATAYVAAGVAVLTVSVGVISVPALGVGILARTGLGGVTSQPLAADLDVRLFDPLDLPSQPPASIAAPQAQPVAEQPAAPQDAAAPEQPRTENRSEERRRTPQRLTPQAAEQRSPSAAPSQQQQSSGGAGGSGGGSGSAANPAPATQPSSSSEASQTAAPVESPSTQPPTSEPSPTDTGTTAPGTETPSTDPSTDPPTTQEPQPEPSTENPAPPAETSSPPAEEPAASTAPEPVSTSSVEPTP
ncbi:molecular chaperone DnaK [Microbacterium sp. SORGH_AS 1204]|uniref:Hsp70 family protein n=1 Tax=Microbacterium sp. SORGH_AS_1204 TaxID=3041785 RepID=UPI00278E3FC4|nr:Hsp70 family protein [Microbacterium sp. SORGH_AS_1204]MDQ1137851.1 molecular chaperone DnaK [Microbacterium sp. SORGH_AS_1204]